MFRPERPGGLELGLAALAVVIGAVAFQLEWRTGEYVGLMLAAVALGMHFQRRLRR